MSVNSLGAQGTLAVGGTEYEIYRLAAVKGLEKLPYSLKVLAEALLRTEDGVDITAEHVEALAHWDPKAEPDTEIPFTPARVVMQDFTGVPVVVDLATMREAVAELGGDPAVINPLAPAEMVIDHSVQIDVFGRGDALKINTDMEYERNRERYQLLRWGQTAFDNFRVVPPGTGIVHQVNLEYLSPAVMVRDAEGPDGTTRQAYIDSCVGTDSHTTMINGLGVLGWGVGGIEAEAAMLGQPVSMLIPRVVGFKLTGEIPTGATATDVVLTITEMLRKHGVVGKFVEFYGEGVGAVPLANRATIGNMSPEFGSTAAIFPIDEVTLDYLRLTGRSEEQVALVEAYVREQGMWHDPSAPDYAEPAFSEYLTLDLGTVVPSIAGPKRPQDRISLSDAKSQFGKDISNYRSGDAKTATYTAEDGADVELSDGDVVIASITSCTNTSNPSVMLAAALLARNAHARGLTVKPWVKTSMAPGSKVVTDYYEKAGLWPDLEALGYHLVGYGCTTCIGNSGPLPAPVSAAVNENDLTVVSVLSGNRNFEGRINPDVKMNYLASPPLVIAYALAGTMDFDFEAQSLGTDKDGAEVFLRDIWPSPTEVEAVVGSSITRAMFVKDYADVFAGDDRWTGLPTPDGRHVHVGRRLDVCAQAPVLRGHGRRAGPGRPHRGRPRARLARRLRHHGPHLARGIHQVRQPRGEVPHGARRRPQGLQLLRQPTRQPRGHDPRDLREHPPQEPAARRRRGQRRRGRLHPEPPHRRAGDDLRRSRGVRGGRRAARGARGQGVRHGIEPRLGGQGHAPAGRARGDRGELRAHPPVQPHRHGRAAAPVPRGRERGEPRPRRHGGIHDRRDRRAEPRRASARPGRHRDQGRRERRGVPGRCPDRHAG